jgi:acetyl/propionyl-CoA carboxylase alpha subunit
MEAAGVPVVPGESPGDQSDAALVAAVERVGRPAIVKPSEGGGGIGMRVVHTGSDAVAEIQAARRAAEHAFGDGSLYVERLVERPRHVEIQVFADAHETCVSLFERECSLQRRHQKVVEESPSPVMTPELRQKMGDAAVAAARAAGYRNAGTVEFLVEDGHTESPRFYFLEMNTRLQVEHPVTEQVLGLDLVRAQLAVAAGQPLPFRKERLHQRGHAIELRVYAEDPAQGFLPQAGPLLLYREPRGPGIRVDSGVIEGGDVPVHYDPLIAKLIVSAETRAGALARADRALAEFAILGIVTNLPVLRALLRHPDVQAGRLDTALVDRVLPSLTASPELPTPVSAVAARYASATPARAVAGAAGHIADPWADLGGWRG